MIRTAENNKYGADIHATAKAGCEKLLKYKEPAFYYILATGMLG
jgi:hypothetical protein